MLHLFLTYLCQCPMSNLKKCQCRMSLYISVPCRLPLSLMLHVDFKKGPCRSVKFRDRGRSSFQNLQNMLLEGARSRILQVWHLVEPDKTYTQNEVSVTNALEHVHENFLSGGEMCFHKRKNQILPFRCFSQKVWHLIYQRWHPVIMFSTRASTRKAYRAISQTGSLK